MKYNNKIDELNITFNDLNSILKLGSQSQIIHIQKINKDIVKTLFIDKIIQVISKININIFKGAIILFKINNNFNVSFIEDILESLNEYLNNYTEIIFTTNIDKNFMDNEMEIIMVISYA